MSARDFLTLVGVLALMAFAGANSKGLAADAQSPAPAVEKIEPGKAKHFVSDKWTYDYGELKMWHGGCIHWGGALLYDGKRVQPKGKQDCIRTPWGWLVWKNCDGKSGHGPAWEVLGVEPAADRILPDPATAVAAPLVPTPPPPPPLDVDAERAAKEAERDRAMKREIERRQGQQ